MEQQSSSSYTLYVQQYWSRFPASILPGFKGQAICAFVSLKAGIENSRGLVDELKGHLAKKISAIAQPDAILFAAELPKTRSGKIMAPAVARHRRWPGYGRHDDTGGPDGGGEVERAV